MDGVGEGGYGQEGELWSRVILGRGATMLARATKSNDSNVDLGLQEERDGGYGGGSVKDELVVL